MRRFLYHPRFPLLAGIALIFIHAVLLVWSARIYSATFDEPRHLAAGAAYWERHDFSIYCLSPPLLRLWGAVPAVLAGADAPDTSPLKDWLLAAKHTRYGDWFMYANHDRFSHLLFLSRLAMIPLSCLGAWLVFVWAKQMYGVNSAIAACALYCFNPLFLAHGALLTTDVGTAACFTAAVWLWWRFCRAPSAKRLLWVLPAALASCLCKFTAILIWPMMLAMAVPFFLVRRSTIKPLLAGWLVAVFATLLLINVVYGFHGTGQKMGSFDFYSHFMKTIRQHAPEMRSPLPSLFVLGFDAQKLDTEVGYPAFLFGRTYSGTAWYFYPASLLVKLPLAAIALIVAAIFSLAGTRLVRGPDDRAMQWSIALAAAVYFVGVMVAGDVNIGTRYLLPAFPPAIVLVSRLWAIVGRRVALWRIIRNGLLGAMVCEVLLAAPRFISYANIAAGGPENGWKLVTDSDFDWGQGLFALAEWMRENKIDAVSLAYHGSMDPTLFDIHSDPLSTEEMPKHPYVAISAYFAVGMPGSLQTEPYKRKPFLLDFADELQKRAPVAILADTILIYRASDFRAAMIDAGIKRITGHLDQ